MQKIRKSDMVTVITGKDKGKKGKVISVLLGNKVLVEGINFVKKHARRTQQDQKGGIIQKEAPLAISNVMVICKRCNKPVKVKSVFLKDKTKSRACKVCEEII